MSMTPEQCRAGRGLLGLSQMGLCESAGISHKPLVDFEGGNSKPYARTLDAIKDALEAAGIEFIDENGGGAGVRLKKAVARLNGRRVADRLVTFGLTFKGGEYECRMSADILDDWDRANHGSRQKFEASFDKHKNAIVVRAQKAIEKGRAKDNNLALDHDDFPETG